MSTFEADPMTLGTLEFARLVKRTPEAELRRMMHGERRGAVLDELVRRMTGVFRADKAGSIDAAVHWVIGDRPDGGTDTYELVIAGGTCRLSPRPEHAPRLTLAIGAVDFLQMVTGNAHPVGLVMRGRMKTKGDPRLTAKFPTLFAVPKP